jgi:hypothetical protein
MTPKERAENYMKLKEGYITPKERAEILYNKYSKEYNRSLCMGTMQQTEHWTEVTKELSKLYKNK